MKAIIRNLLTLLTFLAIITGEEIGATSLSEKGRGIPQQSAKKKVSKSALWKLHHYEVLMYGGKAVRIRLVRKSDGRVRLEAFPYGWFQEYKSGTTSYMKVKRFNSWYKIYAKKEKQTLKSRHKTLAIVEKPQLSERSQSLQTTPMYVTGLGLGYNPSTGYIGPSSQCYNFTTNLNNNILNSSFSSQNTANSFSGQTNASASISASFGLFHASGNASYSNSYMNSANSGVTFFNASSTFNATNTFYGLNRLGNDSKNNFSSQCGSNFLTGTPVGMLVTGAFNWWTTSSSASASIAGSVNASYGLDSISAAVSTGTSNANSSSSYDFTISTTGGGATPVSVITTAYTNNIANMDNCFQGVNNYQQYCDNFISGINGGVIRGVTAFNTTYSAQPAPTDLSGLIVFPSGLQGVTGMSSIAYQSVDSLLAVSEYEDIFAIYKDQLDNYITILNQISTLANRANYLYALLYDSSSKTFLFDTYPSMLDVANNYLSSLSSIYYADRETMVNNLGTCLNATSTSVGSACSHIIDLYANGIRSAYGWYSVTGANPNGVSTANRAFAQQNTIALQYTGQYTDNYSSFPMDMVWAGQLPTSTAWGDAVPTPYDPSSTPALIGFVDYPYVTNGSPSTTPWAMFIPMSNPAYNMTSPLTGFVPELWSFSESAWTPWTGTTLSINGQNGCTASAFNSPCTLSITGVGEYYEVSCPALFYCFYSPTSNTISENIFPISGFFTQ